MIRLPYKILTILFLTVAAIAYTAHTASTKDVLEFIDLPAGEDVQATIDPLLSCRDGIMFSLHTMDRSANTAEGPHRWDISFARDDGSLLLKEYPLWLSKADVPLVLEGRTFPYSGLFTLLWDEPLPVQPLTTCVAGAGTGFCEFKLPIDDCSLNTRLVVDIAQIGPEDTTGRAVNQLVFEVRAYDPKVGTNNGDGIDAVEMSIMDPATGTEVFYTEKATNASEGQEIIYCAFSDDCQPWLFADHGYKWPSGEPVHSGPYILRATARTPDNAQLATQSQIEVEVPPVFDTVDVPAGDFTMGSDTENANEKPAQTVSLDEFWIMTTEVTNRLYAQCVAAGACTRPKDGGVRWRDPAYADHPVAGVDWYQANDFAAWAGGRLPTEAEWEKACRGTDGRTFPWGEALPTNEIANFGDAMSDTTPVGTFPAGASPYGALDMSGNVWEWTSSLFAPYPYVADDGREDKTAGDQRVTRGGSFYYTRYQLTCSFRSHISASEATPQFGFRLVFDHPFAGEIPSAGKSVHFGEPADGATVPAKFDVSMVADGLTVEPAGEIHKDAGHFHILVDTDFIAPGEIIPVDNNHLDFGQGQITTTLELDPGVHVLNLQFANGAHIALDGDEYQDTITVTVSAP